MRPLSELVAKLTSLTVAQVVVLIIIVIIINRKGGPTAENVLKYSAIAGVGFYILNRAHDIGITDEIEDRTNARKGENLVRDMGRMGQGTPGAIQITP